MKGYYTAKRLLSNIDWRSMHDMPLVIKGHTIVAFELRPKEKNVWALNEENDGYHVAGDLTNYGKVIVEYLKWIQNEK